MLKFNFKYNKVTFCSSNHKRLNFLREEAKKKIKDLGGKVSESVSKQTSYVIAGKEPGSKYEKAKSLGVEILNEEDFLKLIG